MDNMETTIQACNSIEHGWEELNNRMAVLSAELQQLDKVRSDILHHIGELSAPLHPRCLRGPVKQLCLPCRRTDR